METGVWTRHGYVTVESDPMSVQPKAPPRRDNCVTAGDMYCDHDWACAVSEARPVAAASRPAWLPDEAHTHWPNGDPVSVRDVLEAHLIPDVPSAFWLHPLPARPHRNRESVSGYPAIPVTYGRTYIPPAVVEEAPALRRHRDTQAAIAKSLRLTGSITSEEYERRLKKIYGERSIPRNPDFGPGEG